MNERKSALIINDEVDLCLLMKTYLLRKNYEVCIAHTFIDALTIAEECQPNIILLSTAICRNPQEDIKKIKGAAPTSEIILDGLPVPNKF